MSGVEEDLCSVASESSLSGDENFVTAEQQPEEDAASHAQTSGDEAEEVEVEEEEVQNPDVMPEIDFNCELTDDIIKQFRRRVVIELKDAYRGKGQSELMHAVDRIVTLYSLAYRHKKGVHFVQLLLMDLERRLCFLIDNNHYVTGRLRALSVMARFASELAKKDVMQNEVVECLVDFIKNNELSASAASRSLICYLSGELLTSCVGDPVPVDRSMSDLNIEEEVEEEEFPLFISLEAYLKIYSVIVGRTNDKSASVRKEALKAISNAQDNDIWGEYNQHVEEHPANICRQHVNDENAEVRQIAVKTLLISDHQRVRDLVAIAVKDADMIVQREAFVRICQDLHIGAFSRAERMALLSSICHHDDVTMRETAVRLITTWATQICRDIQKEIAGPNARGIAKEIPMEMYARTPLYILKYLDILENAELCQTVMLHLFYIASLRYPDISTTPAYVLLIKDENGSLNRQTYESIMSYKLPLVEVAHRLLFWRTFVLFGQRAAVDATEWTEVTHQLLPTLRIFCEFITKFVNFISKKFEGETKEAYKMFAITELLKFPKLMERDIVGTASWRNLLTNLLTSSAIPTDKDLIDRCVADLFGFHYPNPEDVSSGIAEVCDATTILINRELSPDGTQMNGTISLANHGNPTYQPGLEEMEAAPIPQAEGQTLTHCLMIIDALMRTGRVTNLDDPFVSGICDNIIEKGAVSRKAEDRRYAFRCYSVMSMQNISFARSKIPTFKLALQVEVPENKAVVVSAVCDVVMRWTYRAISDAFGFFEVNRKTAELAEVYAGFISNKNLEKTAVPENATRAVMKWMMMEEHEDWVHPLAQILVLASRTEIPTIKTEKQIILAEFLVDFTTKSRNRKVLLARSVFSAIEILKMEEISGSIEDIDLEELIDKVIALTSEESDAPNEERKRGSKQSTPVNDGIPSVHIELLGMTISHLHRNPNDSFLDVYVRLLSMVNLDGLKAEMAMECEWVEMLRETIDELREENQAAVKPLKSFLRSLETRLRSSISTRRRGSVRKTPTRTGRLRAANSVSTDSEDATTTTGSAHSSKASSPLNCRELIGSLPTIDEEEPTLDETNAEPALAPTPAPTVPERLTNGVATRSKSKASKIPVPTKAAPRQRGGGRTLDEEKGGRDSAAQAVSDLTAGVVRLQLTEDGRRPLSERNLSTSNRKRDKSSSSNKTLSNTSEPHKKVQEIPSDDDDDEFITRRRRPINKSAAAVNRKNPVRGARKPVTISHENEE